MGGELSEPPVIRSMVRHISIAFGGLRGHDILSISVDILEGNLLNHKSQSFKLSREKVGGVVVGLEFREGRSVPGHRDQVGGQKAKRSNSKPRDL